MTNAPINIPILVIFIDDVNVLDEGKKLHSVAL